ncbi:uncharacterized protein TNCV_4629011, partial [Trichonephila clavipes]
MEPVGAYHIFERSEDHRMLRYTDYYGDGDSKAFDAVKDIYGKDSVTKLECIGHIQKRVGTRLRKLKSRNKGLGGKLHEVLLATDHVILNHGQVMWTTSELAPPLLTASPHQREDVSALDRFNLHRCPTRRVCSGTG